MELAGLEAAWLILVSSLGQRLLSWHPRGSRPAPASGAQACVSPPEPRRLRLHSLFARGGSAVVVLGGSAMSETCAEPALARYRDSVTDLTEAGEPFGVVEDVINQAGELTDDAKAALWPLAFALRDRDERGARLGAISHWSVPRGRGYRWARAAASSCRRCPPGRTMGTGVWGCCLWTGWRIGGVSRAVRRHACGLSSTANQLRVWPNSVQSKSPLRAVGPQRSRLELAACGSPAFPRPLVVPLLEEPVRSP